MTVVKSISHIGSRGIPGHRGGVERVIEAIAPRLVNIGYKVFVYCAPRRENTDKTWRGVHLIYIRNIQSKYFDTITRSLGGTLHAILNNNDIIHFHSIGSAPLALLPRIFGRKTVVTVHGLDWQRRKWNLFGKLFLLIGERAAVYFPNHTIAVGEEIKGYLEGKYNKCVSYIPNGVELRPEREPNIILELGFKKQSYVLFLARLVPEKQPHILLEAWLQIAYKNGLKLVIAGPEWYSFDYVESIKKLASNDPSVVFLGEVDEELLEELYSNCLAYVLPSEVEGMSLSLLDAMAFGACTICSDIPPNLAVIGDSGLSFRVGDVSDLRQKLELILSNSAYAHNLRHRAKARISSEFSWDVITKMLGELYNKL